MTLYEALLKLYEAYGYYRDGVKSMTMKGLEGMARIQRIMKTFRENTPQELGGYKVVMAKDYQTQVFRNLETGEESGSPLPVSDVLHYTLEDGTWVCIRPSGTEPKLKLYIGVKADGLQAAQDKVDALDADIEAMIAERQEARAKKDFARADAIRDELAAQGIKLLDTKEGVRWTRD